MLRARSGGTTIAVMSAALVLLLLWPGAAPGAPFSVTLDQARLNYSDDVIDSTGNDSTFTGEIDPSSGEVSVPEANVDIADFPSDTFPIFTIPSSNYSGSYDSETGALTLTGMLDVE